MRYVIGILLLASPAFAGEPVYSWRSRTDESDRIYLYRDGDQIGGWCYRTRQYRPFDGNNWGLPTATAPVPPPEQRAVVITQQRPILMTPQIPAPIPLRGPLRVRLGTVMGQAVTDMTMQMFTDAIPRAIAESLKNGQYQLNLQYSVTPSAPQPDGRTNPSGPGQPARSPQGRQAIPRP